MKIRNLMMLFLALTSCAHQPPAPVEKHLQLISTTHLSLPIAPEIGTTTSGQKIALGGFTGLVFKEEKDGELIFQTNTDRGPDSANIGKDHPFLLPDFNPEIVTLKTHLKDKSLEISAELKLKKHTGLPVTGLSNNRDDENPVDANGMPTSIDKDGLDTEGITYDGEGGYWLADEHGPSLVHFDVEGKMLKRVIAGVEIPKFYNERQPDKGFKGIAKFENKIFGILQSPLPKEEGISRIVEVNLEAMRTSAEYLYPMENNTSTIGDMAILSEKSFLVLEQNKIFKITLNGTDQNVSKELISDLSTTSFKDIAKVDGMALIDHHRIALISNNDFQISGKTDIASGMTPMNQSKNEMLILEFNQDL